MKKQVKILGVVGIAVATVATALKGRKVIVNKIEKEEKVDKLLLTLKEMYLQENEEFLIVNRSDAYEYTKYLSAGNMSLIADTEEFLVSRNLIDSEKKSLVIVSEG